MSISHLIACRKYDEKITTILMCKGYDDVLIGKRESNRHQVEKNKKILLVDDEHDVNVTIKIVLEENGFIVDSFTDASQALQNFRNGLYDLVIIDVIMPEMDGFILYERIKKLDKKVIICFLTATNDTYYEILKKNYPNINENCIIRKPVDNESLLRQINSIL